MRHVFAAFAMIGLSATAAETLAVGAQSDALIDVGAGVQATLGTNVLMGSGARLVKTGAGALALPPARFPQGTTATVAVREGEISVTPFVAADVEAPRPDAALAKAAFWFDAAADGTVLVTRSNDVDWVDAWLDVRETGDAANGYTRLRAMPSFLATNVPPQLVEKDGKKALFFGGTLRSGVFMDWRSPAGAWTKLNVRHAFLVHGAYTSQGFLLGITVNDTRQSNGSCSFHIGSSSGNLGCSIGRDIGTDNYPVATGRVYQDGVLVDTQRTGFKSGGFHVIEYDCCGVAGQASNFFNDRNYFADNPAFTYVAGGGNRIGGDYLAEAIVFTNALTEAEHLAVQAWILKKHLGVRQTSFDVTLAEGALFASDAGAVNTTLPGLKGDGAFFADSGKGTLLATSTFDAACRLGLGAGVVESAYALPLAVAGGDRITVAQNGYASPAMSRSADAGVGCVAKDGPGSALITELPDDVKTLRVDAGTLALAAPRRSGALRPGGSAEAAIPNADFEQGPTSTSEYKQDQTVANWHLVGLSSDNNNRDTVIFIRGNGTGGGWSGNASGHGSPLPAPQGQMAMMLKGNASAWTEITVPEDGVYEVSFLCSSRNGYHNHSFDLCIGKDADSLIPFATFTSPAQGAGGSAPGYVPFRFRTFHLAAGTYQFWFRTQARNLDRTAAIDDLRMVRVSDDAWEKIPIPNGSFEAHGSGFDVNKAKVENICPGWILTQNGNGLSAFFSTRTSDSLCAYYDAANVRFGETLLTLLNAGSKAETAPFVPAQSGRVVLRARCCNWRYTNGTPGTSYLSAKVVVGGVTNDLGRLAMNWWRLKDAEWAKPVELVAGIETRLLLESHFNATANDTKCAMLVDDLVFVSVDALSAAYGPELVYNGSFEGSSPSDGWTFTRFTKSGSQNGNMVWEYVGNWQGNYGYAVYAGGNMSTIVQNDITWQEIVVPDAGLYRLRYFAHTRYDNPTGNGLNPVRAFWVDTDEPATTNWIGKTLVSSTNFIECAYNVRLPAKRVVVGLQGCYSHVAGAAELFGTDHTTCIDGVSLRQVRTAGTGLPEIADDVELAVASGAKLRLDYDGVLEVKSLRLGTSGRAGEISSETAPDFIEGPGRLFVKPRGTAIIFR